MTIQLLSLHINTTTVFSFQNHSVPLYHHFSSLPPVLFYLQWQSLSCLSNVHINTAYLQRIYFCLDWQSISLQNDIFYLFIVTAVKCEIFLFSYIVMHEVLIYHLYFPSPLVKLIFRSPYVIQVTFQPF